MPCRLVYLVALLAIVFSGKSPAQDSKPATISVPNAAPPFSFTYDGKPSNIFLPSWQSSQSPDKVRSVLSWLDPQTGLRATAATNVFPEFTAKDWVLKFENTGQQDTPIIEDVQALDMSLPIPADTPVVLDQINGDDCSPNTFMPIERPLKTGESVSLAPVGGRPSNGTFPFFNIQYGDEGMFVAIGWTGQWAAKISRADTGGLNVKAGMELTHLRLHPGESIRTPRILLMHWSGDRTQAHNQFRRLLLTHYQPKLDGKPIVPAISCQMFDRTQGRGYYATEEAQLKCVRINKELGCNSHWLDAAWFEGDFPGGVGNWTPKPTELPNGLKPVGEECEKLGLKFLLWYEPERVADGTRIAREHPEFVLPVKKNAGQGGLFNLGDPKAREWLTNLLIKQIDDFHIHTYRNDFNINPLPFWRANDAEDRQGITEIRYVEGLYAMWDELRARYPKMYLDDCASGGRRIDLEMLARAVVQTRSDTGCEPGRSDWDQCQTYGLSLYFPLHATIGWDIGAYECRSSATMGLCAEWDVLDKDFPLDRARAAIAEVTANRKYWYGDFYPLTPCSLAADVWMAWQLHCPDSGEGMVLAFRRQDCAQATLPVKLRGLSLDKTYAVTFADDQRQATTRRMSGRDLAGLTIEIPKPHGSMMIRYAP